jgi:predicted secreted acid phosphatase
MTLSHCVPMQHPKFNILARMSSTGEALEWGLSFLGAMHHLVSNPCVVFDIDGTVLKNYKGEKGPVTKCVVGFRTFANACEKAGISIFVVTARPDFTSNRIWSMRQLQSCGIEPVVKTYMRPEGEDVGSFKLQSREDIRNRGYHILLSIGDQFLDLHRKYPRPGELDDHAVWVGDLGDEGSYAIKLPSEFPK